MLPTCQQREANDNKRYFKENVFFNCFSSFPKELLKSMNNISLRVFENRVLRRIFGAKRGEVIGE
jgi:hypothetical protein